MSSQREQKAEEISADGLVELEESVLDRIAGGAGHMSPKKDGEGKTPPPPAPTGKTEEGESKKKDVSPTGTPSTPSSPSPPPIFTL